MQGDITECFLVMFIPAVCLIGGMGSTKHKPLALGPEVGLHGGMPLLQVGASEDWDHLVESAGHSSKSCWESTQSASECDIRQARKGNTLSTSESTLSTAILKIWSQLVQLGARLCRGCAVAQQGAHCPPQHQAS